MVNINRLKAAIIERGMSIESVAKASGIEKTGLYRRIKSGGGKFTIDEVEALSKAMGLGYHEINRIFFDQLVASDANEARQ